MNLKQFIDQNQLKPADAVVLKKNPLRVFNHYAIYMGNDDYGYPIFVANSGKGVHEITDGEFERYADLLEPIRIERFQGRYYEREAALERAWSRVGEKKYSYPLNNCEHFKNYVHHGKSSSNQVDNVLAGVGIAAVGLLFSALIVPSNK